MVIIRKKYYDKTGEIISNNDTICYNRDGMYNLYEKNDGALYIILDGTETSLDILPVHNVVKATEDNIGILDAMYK